MPRHSPTLRFHAHTFETVGATPKAVRPVMRLLLAERERACGVTFPPSVREWYLCDGPALGRKLGCGPTADTMVPLRGLGRPFTDWYNERQAARRTASRRPDGRRKPADRTALQPRRVDGIVRTGLVEILIENQGVCSWAVKLDGSDDPPVMIEVESRDAAASVEEIAWQLCAESFSTFMYCRALDFGHCLETIAVAAQAQDRPLVRSDLEFLQSRFAEGPRTHGHPGATNYRFFAPNRLAPDRAILIWDRGLEADWQLVAASDEALLQLLRQVWNCGTLRETLQAGDDPRSQRVLDRVRSEA